MQNDCDREAKEKGLSKPAAPPAAETTTEMGAAATTRQHVDNEGLGVVDQQEPPSPSGASFFKAGVGFLAWALWGHIPLHDGAQMISQLFSEVKANTSYGRGTSTRSAMRQAVISASAAPVDNRRGKKREIDIATHVQPASAAADNTAELALLTKTLEHLSAEAMEKEEKQHHSMRVRLVRDKLAARRRRSEVFLQQLNLASKIKKRPDTTVLDKIEANEKEIENLETVLATLQEEECERHSNMMEKKRRAMSSAVPVTMIGMTPMIGTSGSFESITSGIESSSGNDSGGNDDCTPNNNHDGKDSSTPASTRPNVMMTPTTTPNIMICMECNLIPTNHTCLKCNKVRVCACCCDENRGLRNNTWCKVCFENETPAIQEIIRKGDYSYKD